MALYDKMLEELQAIGSHEEKALNVEYVADTNARAFLWWYQQNINEPWVNGLDNAELYEQFKMTL